MQARLKTSAPQVLVGGVLLVGLALGAAPRLHAADSQAAPTEASVTRDRGDSLVGTLDETFPALRARLRLSRPFEKTTWRHGEESIEGLRPQREVSPEASVEGEPVDVVFPTRASGPVVAEGEGVRVILRPRGAASVPARILDGKLAYLDVYEETDSIHIVEDEWTEEYLYLRSPRAPVRFEYDVLDARGVSSVEIDNAQVHFLNADDEGVVILAPIVVDAAGRRSSTAARWELENAAEARRLVLHLDPAGLDYPLVVDPSWITTGSLLVARQDGVGILLHNGKVLVLGGAPQAELYDIATGTWSPAAAGWPGRSQFAAVLLPDGRVLTTGGFNVATFADCHLYDPRSDTWTPTAPMSTPRRNHTATLLNDGTVLVAGGETAATLATSEIYNPVLGTWAPTGNLGAGKARHTATRLPDGRVLVAGGVTGVGLVTPIAEIYAGGVWTPTLPLQTPRSKHSATLLPDGRVLVAGGGTDLLAQSSAEIFDPALPSWSFTGSLTVARGDHSATLLPSGLVLVTGGANPPLGGPAIVSAELYDWLGMSWAPAPNLSFPRYRHATTMLPDGRVLVAGGFGPGALVTAELYDADTPVFVDHNAMAVARSEHTMTPLADGRVLAAGGNGPGPNTAELYSGGTWAATGTPMTQARWRHTATRLPGGRVLVTGSAASIAAARSAEVYEPGPDTWTAVQPMSVDRYWHTATLLPCGEVLVAAGQTVGGVGLPSAERYNPRSGTWTGAGAMTTPRRRHTATLLLDGRVLVTGGWNGGALNSAELYDPAALPALAWTPAGPMTVAREYHRATLLPSGQVLLVGGFGSPGSAELFDPVTDTFSPIPAPLLAPRDFFFTSTLLRNGRVLVVGGFASPNTAELYDPATGLWLPMPNPQNQRNRHAAAVLPDGHVLFAGGLIGPATTSVEYFDVGRGEQPAWRPVLGGVTDPAVEGASLVAVGGGFTGLGEGSGGLGYMHSAANYPLVQLRRLDNEAVRWLHVDATAGWKDTDFTSDVNAVNGFAPGPARVTVFTNGIPSDSTLIEVECLPPTVISDPVSQDICLGGSANFSVAATGPCVVYQWRKDTIPLSEAAPYAGTRTDTLSITNATLTEVGSYDAIAQLSCSATTATSAAATLTVSANLSGVGALLSGSSNICTTCLGGTVTEAHSGGGPVTYQWGYRLIAAGPITDIPGQTGVSYQINGSDFPGVGSYLLVVRTTPLCGAAQVSNDIGVTVTTATPSDDVEFFTVTSRETENVLEWVNPATYGTVLVHATSGPACTPPTNPTLPATLIATEVGVAGQRHSYPHTPLTPDTTYCYTLFVDKGGSYSAGRSNRGRPMAAGAVQWAFSTGVFTLTAPTVGTAGIIAMSNDNVLHAMERGASPPAGEWPAGWLPMPLGGPVQSRSPIIPIDVGGANPVIYLGSQDGNVYVVDGVQGGTVGYPWPPVALGGLPGQAAPAGMFSVWGTYDYLLLGTRDTIADNRFYAIDPLNGGAPIDFFDNLAGTGGFGPINGMAAVDYANDRVYFATRVGAGNSTLFCLNLLPTPAPVFSLRWERALSDIDSGPVLMWGRVYVGSDQGGGRLYSVDADTGADYSWHHGDGQVKDFVWPDWRNPGDLYFAGDSSIWAVHDFGTYLDWKPPLVGPVSLGGAIPTSAVLLVPGTQFLYVGADDGHLYEIDFAQDPPALKSVQLGDGLATVGSPSLDWPNDLIHVGTEAGVFYAVQVPLP